MSDLEQDFNSLVVQINSKLNEAAKALKEANQLREKAGLRSLIFNAWEREEAYSRFNDQADEDENVDVDELMDEEYKKYQSIDTNALERELGSAGWSTSSSYC